MAVAFRAAGTFATRGSPGTGALSVGVPAGTTTGDLLLLAATSYGGGSGVAINTPAGWTLINTRTGWNSGDPQYTTALYYKVAGASEGAVSMTTAASSYLDAVTAGFTGVDTTTPIDVAGTWSADQSGSTVTIPSITTLTANAWWVSIGVDAVGQLNASSFPAGWTQRARTSITIAMYVVNTKALTAAGATGTATYSRTGASQTHILLGLALRESGAGAGGATFVPKITIV